MDSTSLKSANWSNRAAHHLRNQPLDQLLWHAIVIMIALYGAIIFTLLKIGSHLGVAIGVCCVLYVGLRGLLVFQFEWIKWRGGSRCPAHLEEGFMLKSFSIAREIICYCLLYTFIQPLDRFVMPKLERRKQEEMPSLISRNFYPVLLIHGFFCNSIFWLPTRLYLGSKGIQSIYSITLSPPSGDIKDFSRSVADKVNKILQETGADKIIIVAHSMGGLVARHYIQSVRSHPTVAKLIALGTPHSGTLVAVGAGSQILRRFNYVGLDQMAPGSSFLRNLMEQEVLDNPVPITNIFSYADEIVVPQESCILEVQHAKTVCCCGVAHMSMPFSPHVNRLVLDECTSLSGPAMSHQDRDQNPSQG